MPAPFAMSVDSAACACVDFWRNDRRIRRVFPQGPRSDPIFQPIDSRLPCLIDRAYCGRRVCIRSRICEIRLPGAYPSSAPGRTTDGTRDSFHNRLLKIKLGQNNAPDMTWPIIAAYLIFTTTFSAFPQFVQSNMRLSWPGRSGSILASHIFIPHFGHGGRSTESNSRTAGWEADM
jgi:hypothetical protein